MLVVRASMGWRSKRYPFRWSEDDPCWRCWSRKLSRDLRVVALAKEELRQTAPPDIRIRDVVGRGNAAARPLLWRSILGSNYSSSRDFVLRFVFPRLSTIFNILIKSIIVWHIHIAACLVLYHAFRRVSRGRPITPVRSLDLDARRLRQEDRENATDHGL